MTKLDRKKSYGTVYGDPKVGFVQDDKYFRHDGTLLVEEPNSTTTTPPESKAVESKALDAVPKVQKPRSDEQKAAQSEAMKKIWAERRAVQADKATTGEPG